MTKSQHHHGTSWIKRKIDQEISTASWIIYSLKLIDTLHETKIALDRGQSKRLSFQLPITMGLLMTSCCQNQSLIHSWTHAHHQLGCVCVCFPLYYLLSAIYLLVIELDIDSNHHKHQLILINHLRNLEKTINPWSLTHISPLKKMVVGIRRQIASPFLSGHPNHHRR